MATPSWAVHHTDGSWSCADCGRASRTIDGVRGHRRSCPGVSGLVDRLALISERSISATLSGSQQAAQLASQRLVSRWEPAKSRVLAVPAGEPLAQGLAQENAALRRRIVELEADQLELLEIATNDLPHLAQAAEQQEQRGASPLPWILGLGLAGVTLVWLFSSGDDDDAGEGRPFMGGSRSRRPSIGGLVDKIGSRVVDKVLGKALGAIF